MIWAMIEVNVLFSDDAFSKGADPNKARWRDSAWWDTCTPLHQAAYHGSIEVCRSLLVSGARQDLDPEGGKNLAAH